MTLISADGREDGCCWTDWVTHPQVHYFQETLDCFESDSSAQHKNLLIWGFLCSVRKHTGAFFRSRDELLKSSNWFLQCFVYIKRIHLFKEKMKWIYCLERILSKLVPKNDLYLWAWWASHVKLHRARPLFTVKK